MNTRIMEELRRYYKREASRKNRRIEKKILRTVDMRTALSQVEINSEDVRYIPETVLEFPDRRIINREVEWNTN